MEKVKRNLILNNKKQKLLIIGMPTIGKTTFYNNNRDVSWDFDFLYKLISTINDNYIDTYKNDNILFNEICPSINSHIIESNKFIILHSIIGIEYLDYYNFFLKNGFKIIFITRSIDDYLDMWKRRHDANPNTIYNPTFNEALGCINTIKKINKIIKSEIIELGKNEFLSDLILIDKI